MDEQTGTWSRDKMRRTEWKLNLDGEIRINYYYKIHSIGYAKRWRQARRCDISAVRKWIRPYTIQTMDILEALELTRGCEILSGGDKDRH